MIALGFLHGGRSENLINTSLQRGGWAKTISDVSRFNGLRKKPLKRLICRMQAGATSLKRGVNEISKVCKVTHFDFSTSLTAPRARSYSSKASRAGLAQLVERAIRNRKVIGSTPIAGSSLYS
jgi:hypothetical protein